MIERSVIISQTPTLTLSDKLDVSESEIFSQKQNLTLKGIEYDYISQVLDSTYWRIEGHDGAAKIIGLNPSTLRSRMKKLGISRSKPLKIIHK